jgi:hypothetical protein
MTPPLDELSCVSATTNQVIQLSRIQDTTVEKKNQECQFRLLVMGVWNKQHGWPVVLLLGFVKHDAVGLVLKFKIGFTCF